MLPDPLPQPVAARDLHRLLLGPGPSNADPRVAAATGLPLIGHMDPAFVAILDEICSMLRPLFGTTNPVTFAASGTGSAGMELLAMNLIEPGDTVIVGVNGVFGGRIAAAARKLGATVVEATAAWGQPLEVADVAAALMRAGGSAHIVWLVLAETSTGVRQHDIAAFADLAHDHGALLLLDCVTALGGLPLCVDAWGVDAAFAGTQKCLGVTPGCAPVTLGPRALAKFQARRAPVPSWYFDLEALLGYWEGRSGRRIYHHTAPIAPLLGLHESLRLLHVEGLEAVFARHAAAAVELSTGLEKRGFMYVVSDPAARLPMLHAVRPPAGVDEAALRTYLLREHGIEIGAGLGALAGQAVRIGLMGPNARSDVVQRLLAALDAGSDNGGIKGRHATIRTP